MRLSIIRKVLAALFGGLLAVGLVAGAASAGEDPSPSPSPSPSTSGPTTSTSADIDDDVDDDDDELPLTGGEMGIGLLSAGALVAAGLAGRRALNR